MDYKGIIFDFNGTLFWDSDKHESAWQEVSKQLRGTPFTREELNLRVHGRTNKNIFEYLFHSSIEKDKLIELSEKKEKIYRDLCLNDSKNFKLATGAELFLDYLKNIHFPITIATASDVHNLNFYIEYFHLEKWFSLDKIIYDDGTFAGKPEPDIYIKAAHALNLEPKQCIVIEDAISGMKSAYSAGIGKIVAIAPCENHGYFNSLSGVSTVIKDFNNFRNTILA